MQRELIELVRKMKKDRLHQIEAMTELRLKHIHDLQEVRLQSLLTECDVLEGQIKLVNTLDEILSQDRRRRAGTSVVTPLWNPISGELWYAGYLVKKFVRPAPNQRQLLDWFRSNRFKTPLTNPFLSCTSLDAAVETCIRTVDGLNENHRTPRLLRFGHQDNGMKVYWQGNPE